MTKEQNINQLPKDWKWVKLGDAGKIISGGTPSTAVPEYWKGNINWIAPSDLTGYKKKTIKNGAKSITEIGLKNSSARLMPKGSVLFSSRAPIGYVVIADEELSTNQGFKSVIPNENINSDFLYYFLLASKRNAQQVASGTTFKEISLAKFSELKFPLPPKSTQQAIVSKIEELFSELDKGIENLRTAQQQLKTYRQSVLKWAFEGKLTNENVEDGELPKGWKWLKFGELFSESPQNGLYKSSTEYGSGTPIIRIDGFYDGIILSDYQYKRVRLTDEEINRYLISVGDILVNRVNSMPYLGKCGIVKHLKEKTVFESNIMKLRVKRDTVSPEYLTMYLSSKKGIMELRKNAKQAVNQASINQTDVSNVIVPLPLIEEQNNIVQQIESRLSVADKMEESITQSLQQSEALRQSILKKAFEGKLI